MREKLALPNDTRLYLDFEVSAEAPQSAREMLAALLDAGPISSVLIRSAADAPLSEADMRALISVAQKKSVAALIADDVSQARLLGADGVHFAYSPDSISRLRDARRVASASMILGADAGNSRHNAMELGEAGADYIAFAIPPGIETPSLAFERQLDLVAWWNEIFELPSVAFDVAGVGEARRLSEAGADFVAVTVRQGAGLQDAVMQIHRFADAVTLQARAE